MSAPQQSPQQVQQIPIEDVILNIMKNPMTGVDVLYKSLKAQILDIEQKAHERISELEKENEDIKARLYVLEGSRKKSGK